MAGRDADVEHARARAAFGADTRALVRSLLPAAEAGEQLDERLAERAEGNPLFAEQLVALLREDGDVSLPPTIQALLAARLDRLPPAERAAIGAASVVGREFWGDAVGALLPDQDEQGVRELLTTLAAKRLVMPEESTLESEEGYSFTHVLVRDAAYEALTKQDRADLHERVADWLERRHPERMIELEAIVGHHLEDAYRHHADLGPIGPRGYALAQRAARRLAAAGSRAARAREDTAAAGLLERAADLLPANASERVAMLPADRRGARGQRTACEGQGGVRARDRSRRRGPGPPRGGVFARPPRRGQVPDRAGGRREEIASEARGGDRDARARGRQARPRGGLAADRRGRACPRAAPATAGRRSSRPSPT